MKNIIKVLLIVVTAISFSYCSNNNTSQAAGIIKQDSPCKYIFINKNNPDGIKIEVRLGNDDHCEKNKSQGEFLLKQDAKKEFSSLEDCCYRKSLDDGNTWSDYINIAHCLGNGDEKEIEL